MVAAEHHFSHRIGWLRATVLGANDGIVSIMSLIVGVSAAHVSSAEVLLAGIAGLTAGTISMAAGEYVSVNSQADTEKADLLREKEELEKNPDSELLELTHIYIERGLTKPLAKEVAEQLTKHDALGAHLRDELGFLEEFRARPVQAALASSASFLLGGLPPILLAAFLPVESMPLIVSLFAIVSLALLGFLSAKVGGSAPVKAILRVTLWGAFALASTALIGHLAERFL